MNALRFFCFPHRVVSGFLDMPWPSLSPNKTAPDFIFSVGLFKK
jgi:hypothetical protein